MLPLINAFTETLLKFLSFSSLKTFLNDNIHATIVEQLDLVGQIIK